MFLATLSEIRIPIPPPLLLVLFFPTHLYPLIDIWSPVFIFISVMRAMSIFSVWTNDCRLFIFPFRPLTLIATTVISLFFLIPFLSFSFLFLNVIFLCFGVWVLIVVHDLHVGWGCSLACGLLVCGLLVCDFHADIPPPAKKKSVPHLRTWRLREQEAQTEYQKAFITETT